MEGVGPAKRAHQTVRWMTPLVDELVAPDGQTESNCKPGGHRQL